MLYFLVYNDNTHNHYVNQLLRSLEIYGKEFEIMVFNKRDMDNDFCKKHNHILKCSRGGGYWLWKPYMIHKTLQKINENDIIFYLDSKYYFIEPFTNLYLEYMKHHDLLVWKNKPNEPIWYMKNFCKMDVIHKYNMYDRIFNQYAEDCWGGALVIKKTETTMRYIQEWLDMSCIYENITDSPSIIKNNDEFIEHRHDQSLLSIILHKYNIELQYFEKKYLQNVRTPY
jgi:hypothetical protein